MECHELFTFLFNEMLEIFLNKLMDFGGAKIKQDQIWRDKGLFLDIFSPNANYILLLWKAFSNFFMNLCLTDKSMKLLKLY